MYTHTQKKYLQKETAGNCSLQVHSYTTGSTNCRRLSIISQNCCSKLRIWPTHKKSLNTYQQRSYHQIIQSYFWFLIYRSIFQQKIQVKCLSTDIWSQFLKANPLLTDYIQLDCTQRTQTSTKTTNSNQNWSRIRIRISGLLQMSAGLLPKCCGFITPSASVIVPSVVKISRWLHEKC